MPKVIFLVGLCGAGKSRKANQLKKAGYVFVEGYESKPTEAQRMLDTLRAGKNCVAEEMQTLSAVYRAAIEAHLKGQIPGLEVKFWFFEKDIIKATLNVLSRNDRDKPIVEHLLANGHLYHKYDFPTDPKAIILPIDPPTLSCKKKLAIALALTGFILAGALLGAFCTVAECFPHWPGLAVGAGAGLVLGLVIGWLLK